MLRNSSQNYAQDRVTPWVKPRIGYATRWKASWVDQGFSLRSKSEATLANLVNPACVERQTSAATKWRGAISSCLCGDKDVRGWNASVQAPPVRSTRNAGGQHSRRAISQGHASCRARRGSAETKEYADSIPPKRARVKNAAHLPRSRQRELNLDRLAPTPNDDDAKA